MIRRLTVLVLSGVICLLGVTSVFAMEYNESPMLRVKVAAGELPSVEERLPEEPLVLEPIKEIGQYGGDLHVLSVGPNRAWGAFLSIGMQPLLRLGRDYSTLMPNIAKSWNLSEDKKTLTIYLRKGMKWSDGVPFTADDIMFWYEDMLLNDELTPVKPKIWSPGGELMRVERIGDYTVSFHFAASYPLVKYVLAHFSGTVVTMLYPKHYLKNFHIGYNPKANEIAKEKGFDFWYQYFGDRRLNYCTFILNPDCPTLFSYMVVERKPGIMIFERNPYFWKVDTKGNQLPYIDRVVVTAVENVELYNGKILSGEVDLAGMGTSFANYPLYKESGEKAGYRVLLWSGGKGSECYYQVNQTYEKDPILRDIFRDVRFRRALSLAINRDDINDVIYAGLATPRQMTVVPESAFYEEEFAKSYAEYNPEKANALLDEMGLKWDKSHEHRLRPDGKELRWELLYYQSETPKGEISELVTEYWREIGIQVDLKSGTRELVGLRVRGNEAPMSLWHGDSCTDVLFPFSAIQFIPQVNDATAFGTLWKVWYDTKGEEGEEPPEEIKNLFDWFDKLQTIGDVEWGKKILRSQAENVWSIGTVGLAPQPLIVNANIENVPEKGIWCWDTLFSQGADPEQFFFKQK